MLIECKCHLLFVPWQSDYLLHHHIHLLLDVYDASLTNKFKERMLVSNFDRKVSKPFECTAFSQKNNEQGKNSGKFLLCARDWSHRPFLRYLGLWDPFQENDTILSEGILSMCNDHDCNYFRTESSVSFFIKSHIFKKNIIILSLLS